MNSRPRERNFQIDSSKTMLGASVLISVLTSKTSSSFLEAEYQEMKNIMRKKNLRSHLIR
jgi:hypothetical protein